MSIGNKKYVFVMVGLFLLIGVLNLTLLGYYNSNNQAILDEVRLKNIEKVDKNNFAIMVEKEDGTGYEESDTFPSGMFLNKIESGCIDENGEQLTDSLEYSSDTNSVKIRSKGQAYCYLYFDLIRDDLTVGIQYSGADVTSIPTSFGTERIFSCNKSTYTWNERYQRIEFSSLTNGTECKLNYVTGRYTLLSDVVTSAATSTDAGYRYTGKSPNNYVWFNNELWRIIGLVPACTTASSGTCSDRSKSLVKIIRNESIGAIRYNTATTNIWYRSSLYSVLNGYYWSKQTLSKAPCYIHGYIAGVCDYANIGLSSDSTDYYGRMVVPVYWDVGTGFALSYTTSVVYNSELASVTPKTENVGLMNVSDFGYAAGGASTSVNAMESLANNNWLYSQANEWTLPGLVAYYNGVVSDSTIINSQVRPVVYVSENVYKISGSGTPTDPYIIG